jgi:hypothetical protein
VTKDVLHERRQAFGVDAGAVEVGLRDHLFLLEDGHATGSGGSFEGEEGHRIRAWRNRWETCSVIP